MKLIEGIIRLLSRFVKWFFLDGGRERRYAFDRIRVIGGESLKEKHIPWVLLGIIYLSFISLGLPDGLLGVAWPAMRAEYRLPLETVGVLSMLVMCMSALSSVGSGYILPRFGTGRVTFLSCLLTGAAMLGYAFAPGFLPVVLLTIPLGLGAGAVDSGLNRYVAEHYSSRHMNWLHCFWGIGASAGPLIMTGAILHGGWRMGYFFISLIQLALSLALLYSLRKGLWRSAQKEGGQSASALAIPAPRPATRGTVVLAVALFFLYAGTEYSAGLWVNSVLVESRQVPQQLAGMAVTAFYFCVMLGRFSSGVLVGKLGNMRMMRLGFLLAFLGACCFAMAGKSYPLSLLGVILLGLGLAPIYPCLMHETPRRFEEKVYVRLIGYQVGAACLGGSVTGAGIGLVLSHHSLEWFAPILGALAAVSCLINETLERRTKGEEKE